MLSRLATLREDREKGFTLAELLVVVLVIGILTSVSVPIYMNQRSSAVESTLKSDLRNAGTLLQGQKKFTGSLAPDTKMSEGIQLVAMRKTDRNNLIKVSQFEDGSTTNWGMFISTGGTNSNNFTHKVFTNVSDGYQGMNYRRMTLNTGSNAGMGHTLGFNLPEMGKKGDKYSVGIAIRTTTTRCVDIYVEFKNGSSWPGGIDQTKACGVAGEWKYFTAHGEMDNGGSNRINLSMYVGLNAGEYIDVTGAVLVKGDHINAGEALSKTGYDYCVQGYHQDHPENIWRYSSIDGGVAEGRC